jgi:ATP-binding cassette subfamily B protein
MHQIMRSLPPEERSGNDRETLRRVVGSFRPYSVPVAFTFLLTIAIAVLTLVNPLLTRVLFDDAFAKRNQRVLVIVVAAMIVSAVLAAVLSVLQTWLNARVGQRVMQDLRDQLYEHLQRMPLQFFTSTKTGEIQSRLANDVGGIEDVLSTTFVNAVRNVSLTISTVVAMVILSPLLTAISLCFLPVVYLISSRVGARARAINGVRQEHLANLTAIMQETLSVSGALLIKVFGRQEESRRDFAAENLKLADISVTRQMIGVGLMTLSMIVFSLAPALVYFIAGWEIIHQPHPALSIGTVIAFTTLQARLVGGFGPITQLLNIKVQMQGSLALFDRIYAYLDMPVSITDRPGALALDPDQVRGQITFDHVYFRYEELAVTLGDGAPVPLHASTSAINTAADVAAEATREWVLEDVSFDAQPGRLVALVGPSGAGKSTVISLVPRLYDVNAGAVAIDGHDVKDVTLASLASLIGMVTQETYLFHDTVRANLIFARPNATDAEIVAAARAAAIHDRIMELEHGYETVVGERGYKLSGGEKQRMAIARAILKDPRIQILDAATSALDSASERLVQGALATLMQGRTTMAIAHRLSTIMAADLILVVEVGRIVERGTHEELLARNGLYARLYQQQFTRKRATVHAPDEGEELVSAD